MRSRDMTMATILATSMTTSSSGVPMQYSKLRAPCSYDQESLCVIICQWFRTCIYYLNFPSRYKECCVWTFKYSYNYIIFPTHVNVYPWHVYPTQSDNETLLHDTAECYVRPTKVTILLLYDKIAIRSGLVLCSTARAESYSPVIPYLHDFTFVCIIMWP